MCWEQYVQNRYFSCHVKPAYKAMDRITPLGVSFICYTAISILNYRVTKCPASLNAPNKTKEYRDFYGQHVSFVHAWITVLLGLYVYMLEGGVDYEMHTNQWHVIVMAHSLGYFMYDTCYAEYFGVHDTPMRFHHVFSLFGGFTLYFSSYGGSAAVLSLLLGEVSNPWIMKRHIMRTKGQEQFLMYSVYEYTFAVTFLLIRSIGASFITYNMWISPINYVAKCNVSALYGIGLFWCFVILGMLHKKLKQEKAEPSCGRNLLAWLVHPLRHHLTLLVICLVIISTVIPIVLTQVYHFGYVNVRVGDTNLL